jgi:hypothetical protein
LACWQTRRQHSRYADLIDETALTQLCCTCGHHQLQMLYGP